MKQPICAISADWHLDRYAWAKHPGLAGDSYFSVSQVVNYCVNNQLPLIAAGDLFDDSAPDSYTVWVAMSQLDRLRLSSLPFYFIQGQHERSRDVPWLSIGSGTSKDCAKHVHKKVFKIKDVGFYGLDFCRSDSVKAELDTIPVYADCLVAHQVWYDLMGRFIGPEVAIADVPHVSMVVTGDFHEHKTFKAVGKTNQEVTVLSPGSLCMQSINEPPNKSFFVLYDDLSFESIPIQTRPVYHFKLNTDQEVDEFLSSYEKYLVNDLPQIISKPIFHIVCDGSVKDAYVRLKAMCFKSHFFFNLLHNRRTDKIIKTDRISIREGVEGCLKGIVKENSSTYRILTRLIRCNDPTMELEDIVKEIRNGTF